MDYSIYTLASLFLIYSFLGWCAEVIFVVLDTHAFDNRGFLRGPVCPIYGFGIILVVSCLNPLAGTWIRLFFASVALTTALELVVGIFLKKVFHHEWWNYDEFRFNLCGSVTTVMSVIDRQHWDPDQEQQAQEARKLLTERIPLLVKKNHVHQRILRAFSFLHKEKYKAAIADLKRYLLRTPPK